MPSFLWFSLWNLGICLIISNVCQLPLISPMGSNLCLMFNKHEEQDFGLMSFRVGGAQKQCHRQTAVSLIGYLDRISE